MSRFNMLLYARPKPSDWQGERVLWCEHKLDGVRLSIIKDADGTVVAIGRKEALNLWPKLKYLTELSGRVSALPGDTMLDGELCPDTGSSSDVSAAVKARQPLRFRPFAVPVLQGIDRRTSYSLPSARTVLAEMGFEVPQLFPLDGESYTGLQNKAKDLSIEGFVLKAQHYAAWYRVKPVQTLDAVVTVAYEGTGRLTSQIGGLELHVYAKGGIQVDIGSCGSGLNDAERIGVSRESLAGRVCEVAYDEVTADLKLRFPRFMRWRDDKPAAECSLKQLLDARRVRFNRV